MSCCRVCYAKYPEVQGNAFAATLSLKAKEVYAEVEVSLSIDTFQSREKGLKGYFVEESDDGAT